jgi:hypothetical protein
MAVKSADTGRLDDFEPGVPDDEVDLSKATLFADNARGVFIPQYFAECVQREYVTGVSKEDYDVLLAGPDHEHYWEAWADVVDNATINDPVMGPCYLYEDGDLWVVPKIPFTKVLGHTFKPFDQSDWDCFAGAEKGSSICYCNDGTVLILSPDGGTVSEITDPVQNPVSQSDWTRKVIL